MQMYVIILTTFRVILRQLATLINLPTTLVTHKITSRFSKLYCLGYSGPTKLESTYSCYTVGYGILAFWTVKSCGWQCMRAVRAR